ncbi:peptide/nickel transport system ATP-binding protein [Saccharopolyspora antimicrobica]|uniref:Peptide/nickel transport system ATP-binding protein n=1 Tax=Saccharopolyspora antimicrobica TaxID=455193 RepID=A0A1I4ZXX5_9PSEU|nr:ABC transporter ATP-binding protein [Saccharopolyspora antimicrobica]RKT83353.1 peptide/nickel transport system ATP-binding protein [Saccharopolyspora antimicrobica]SFN55084.1 peptide/nickel transport system ATP-binding protein [Saccharopolyspora antimicrobica]
MTAFALDAVGLEIRGVPSEAAIVADISLTLAPGEILGLIGESGSGKTTLGLAMLRYCKRGTRIADGRIHIGDTDLTGLPAKQAAALRGRRVAYIPQSPASALNPALRLSTQLAEAVHDVSGAAARERIKQVLAEVALPDDDDFLRRYPHQLSGGQQQRIAIAMAFVGRPEVVVLDEPTTGLDVTTQKKVLATIREMCERHGTAGVYISHDMAVVAELADRIAVMYSGRIVETGPTDEVLNEPHHHYTAGLVLAVPDLDGKRAMQAIDGQAPSPLNRPGGCAFAPRCAAATDECRSEVPALEEVAAGHEIRCLNPRSGRLVAEPRPADAAPEPAEPVLEVRNIRAWYTDSPVLQDVSLAVSPGTCLALLGESGSGKTTLSRCLAGLHPKHEGSVLLRGSELAPSSAKRTRDQRRQVQYVFQNPYESLNPRRRVRDLIAQPISVLGGDHGGKSTEERVIEALELAALRPDIAERYPDQLSGGERQRVAIARALVTRPEVLICDEITSALDVSVQSAIVDLLRDLREKMGLALVFVTHNIALVRNIAQQVAVLQGGRIVEQAAADELFAAPQHEYTRSLLTDAPNFQLEASDR